MKTRNGNQPQKSHRCRPPKVTLARLAYLVWRSGRKAIGRVNANRRCAGNTGSYKDNFRIPIWVQGHAFLLFRGAEADKESGGK